MALHDPETQLPTEALFLDRLEQAIHLARRRQNGVALLTLPLLEKPAGIDAVRTLAERLAARLRASDSVTSLDGRAFLVLLSEVEDRAAAWAVAEELLLTVRQPKPTEAGTPPPAFSEDYTLTVFPEDGETATALWRHMQGEVS